MKKMLKRLCTGFLALATVVTALPTTPVHAESKQYWTESAERVGIIEKVMNDGSIGSTFNEGMMKVEGETAYCIDINTDFKNGYKTRADASSRMSADQISDVALSLEYVKQYGEAHKELNYKQVYLLEQCVVWQRLSVHLGWQCDNVRASYDEIPKATQDEVFSGAKAFVKENKGRYECGGYIYSGEGQELGQFWAKLNVGNTKLQKVSSKASITDGNGNYSIAGATYGVFSDKDCTKQLATLTTDENGNTDIAEVKAGTVYIKELYAPAGYKVDKTVYSLKVEVGKTAILKVSDTPKVTDTLIELFKIDMETQKDNPQGNASLAGAEFTWKYYAGFYNKDNLPAEATRTWVTKTIAETDSDGTAHYITKLADAYKVSGDSFYIQCQFDCKLKRVVKGIVRNYRKELKRRRNKEISYCELPEIVVEKLAVWDEYESDYTAFDVCGIEVRVLDDDLAEAIKYLSEKDREILLMYFFLGMSDTEIGDRLKINRSTSFRSRKNSLEEIKKKLKENMNDE